MRKLLRGYKFKIYPTEDQKDQINQLIDFTRAVYNWGLGKEYELFEQHNNKTAKHKYKIYSYFDLEKMFREERDTNPKKSWFGDHPLTTAKYALRNVHRGLKMFLDHINPGKPKFKKKNQCKKSFNTRQDTFKIKYDKVRFEGVDGFIDLKFDSGLDYDRVINPAVSLDNLGNYYVAFSLEVEMPDNDKSKSEPLGIDLGLVNTMTLSNGMTFNQSNKKIQRIRHRRKRKQRQVTRDINRRLEIARHTKTKYRDIPKSKNAIKRELDLNKSFKKEHDIKNTEYHTFTKRIVDMNPEYVVMETFQVRRIQRQNPYLSSKIAQVSFYTLTHMMKYKCENRNIPFIQAHLNFPSSQICSNCGSVKKTKKRQYKCTVCGLSIDRDINAAINLKKYGSRHL